MFGELTKLCQNYFDDGQNLKFIVEYIEKKRDDRLSITHPKIIEKDFLFSDASEIALAVFRIIDNIAPAIDHHAEDGRSRYDILLRGSRDHDDV